MTGTLIVGPAWIGDMVMAHALVQTIHAADSSRNIEMLAPPASAPIAQRMAEISQVHVLKAGHGELGLGERWRMGRLLRSRDYSQAFVLPNSWKSALVPFFASVPKRTGWLGEARFGLLNDTERLPKARLPLMIERFMGLHEFGERLPESYPQPKLRVDTAQQQMLLERHELLQEGRAIALCPGAEFGQAKRWPAEHFVHVAREALNAGLEVWLLGGPGDREVCRSIVESASEPGQEQSAKIANLAGETALTEAVDLLAAASAVVCNDSGLMHVACAVDTPVIALYGSTSPSFTPPLHPEAKALTLVEINGGADKLDCQPCFERTCRYGHGDCLARLSPQHVIGRLADLELLSGVMTS